MCEQKNYAFGGKKQDGAIIRRGAIIGTNRVCASICKSKCLIDFKDLFRTVPNMSSMKGITKIMVKVNDSVRE